MRKYLRCKILLSSKINAAVISCTFADNGKEESRAFFFLLLEPICSCSTDIFVAATVTTYSFRKCLLLTGHAEQHALLLPLRDSSLLAYLKSSLQKFTAASMPSRVVAVV